VVLASLSKSPFAGFAPWIIFSSTVISMGAIAVVVFASLSFVPFTEQYARETVPKEVQETAS
jgi:hypothetical protein